MYHTCDSQTPEPLELFSGSCTDNHNDDLKQIDFRDSQQRWVYTWLAIKGLQPWSHLQVPGWQGKEKTSTVEKGSWEGWRKQKAAALHWLNRCQERRGVFLLPIGSTVITGSGSSPDGLPNLFNGGFHLLIFLEFLDIVRQWKPKVEVKQNGQIPLMLNPYFLLFLCLTSSLSLLLIREPPYFFQFTNTFKTCFLLLSTTTNQDFLLVLCNGGNSGA